ncbi:MAG TPA: hypothetical protein DIV79_01010 [Opitutae bacterium]|nr:hypothetical protein [Opitutaceae bacterium]HCR28581.1 hypothetical protein [Opitutae bacterium]
MKHRAKGYALLTGTGIEIGALHEPATLPESCTVRYFDALDTKQAADRFSEIDPEKLVEVDIVGDIDKRDLRNSIEPNSCDFVIANHVIEHVACPIAMIEDAFRILKSGGIFVISAPDKQFTFDRERSLTPYSHLEAEYAQGVDHVDDEHYLDFLRHVAKHVFEEPGRDIKGDIAFARSRREHAHVWDSDTFQNFLERCRSTLGISYQTLYKSDGNENGLEYFAVLRKDNQL